MKVFSVNTVNVTVFLVSLKAGGVALNLTEASRVYLMDSWWNPAVRFSPVLLVDDVFLFVYTKVEYRKFLTSLPRINPHDLRRGHGSYSSFRAKEASTGHQACC
jgi:hypothetical protein